MAIFPDDYDSFEGGIADTDLIGGSRPSADDPKQRKGLVSTLRSLFQSASNTAGKAPQRDAGGVVTVSGVQLDTAATPTQAAGLLSWDATHGLPKVGLSATEDLTIGAELRPPYRNSTGSTMANGTWVYVSGPTDSNINISRAQANALATCRASIGIVTSDAGIPNNQTGGVCTYGISHNHDTSAYAAGDILWGSPTVAGGITNVEPTTEGHFKVKVGTVQRAHATQGEIFVDPEFFGSVTGDAVASAVSKSAARTAIDLGTSATYDTEDLPVSTAQEIAIVEAAAGSSLTAPTVFDDFQRANGLLNGSTTRSGSTWALTGNGASTATITDGKYVTAGVESAYNTYAYLDYGSAIPRIEGTFSFVKGAGANQRNSTSLTLIADKAGVVGGLSDMLHFRLSPDFWSIEKRNGGEEPFPVLATGRVHLQEGVVYSAAIEISGSTIRVYPPQGDPVDITDSDIGDMAPLRYGNWQIRNLTDSWVGRWHSAQMGESNFDKRSDSVPPADVGFLRGSGINARQKTSLTLSGGSGWYRVATESGVFGSANIIGDIWFTASNVNGTDAVILRASASNSTLLTFHQLLYMTRGTPAITQTRISRLAAGNVALDVFLNVATETTIDLNFFGYATPAVNTPTVGAVALATDVITLTLNSLGTLVGDSRQYGNFALTTGSFSIAAGNLSVTNTGAAIHTITGASEADIFMIDAAATSGLRLANLQCDGGLFKLRLLADNGLSVTRTPWSVDLNTGITTFSAALPAGSGGTGQSSYTVGDLLYASTTTALSKLAAGTSDYVLTANGAGAAPSWKIARLKSYTVATLPVGTAGDTAYVTDATAPTYLGALTGGGAVVCPVFYNGSAWVSA